MAAGHNRASRGRFVSSNDDVLHGNTAERGRIMHELAVCTSNDINQLRSGLRNERSNSRSLDQAWRQAETWFYKHRGHPNRPALNQPQYPDEFHIALAVYAIEGFYAKFNCRTRQIRSISEIKHYPYRSFFKILLLAVVNIKRRVPADPNQVLYRGMSVDIHLQQGQNVMFQNFLSTSRNIDVALGFASGGRTPCLFVIENIIRSGLNSGMHFGGGIPNVVYMDEHSFYSGEEECLIWPMEAFRVTKVVKRNDGLKMYYLKA